MQHRKPTIMSPSSRRSLRNGLLASSLLSLLLLPGCGFLTESKFSEPKTTVPAGWANGGITPAAYTPTPDTADGADSAVVTRISRDAWWTVFNDPQLDQLVDAALARNNDLAAAAVKVRKALIEVGLAENDFLPSFDGSADATSTHTLKTGQQSKSYAASLQASWELDLWGRIAHETAAAKWEADATEKDRQAAALSLIGTVVDLYWQIGFLNQRIAIAQGSIDYAQQTLQLVQVQHGAGAVSALEEQQALESLRNQEAALTDLQQQRVEARNALAILFDQPPQGGQQPLAGVGELASLDRIVVPDIEAGIPAEVLKRRPDVQAAELRLRETLAVSDETKASFLPTISLTGSLGSSSIALTDLMKNPIGTLGAGVALPFLNLYKMDQSIKASKADYAEAVINFRQTLYSAFSDVENALSARRQYAVKVGKLQQAYQSARQVEGLQELRYRAGAIALKDWLDAQEDRRTTEADLVEARYDGLINYVALAQALGGGIGRAAQAADQASNQ
jgi:NodT family efflux transporter outer membrane factor (OMF) lipoprotein